MRLRVDVDLSRLGAGLRRPGGVGERLVRERAERAAVRARQLAPGRMGDRITVEPTVTGRGVAVDLAVYHPAAGYVIHGTRPHVIVPRRGRALRFRVRGRTVFAARVRHPGSAPNNFLMRAVRETR